MSLSKIDIENKRFRRSFRGYDPEEVADFMAEAAETIGEMAETRVRLTSRISELEAALDEYRRREATLRDTLMTTQKMIDELKANARKEAQLILDEARNKADSLVGQAHMRMAQIHDDIVNLKRQRSQFEVKLKSLLDAHLRLLEIESAEEEQLEMMESKIAFLKPSR